MKPDAIIALGGGIDKNGLLSSATKSRVEKAIQLFQKLLPNGLIISGRWSLLYKFTPKTTEAEASKELAIKLGIPAKQIFVDTQSIDTIGNAYFVKKLFLEPKSWTKVLVVTSDFHRRRANCAFQKVLGPKYTINFSTVRSTFNPIKRAKLEISEHKLLKVYKKWLDPIPDGADAKIKALLDQLPGYSQNPKYSVDELINTIARQ